MSDPLNAGHALWESDPGDGMVATLMGCLKFSCRHLLWWCPFAAVIALHSTCAALHASPPATAPVAASADWNGDSLARLIADLSDDQFAVRKRATMQLESLPPEAVPQIEEIIATQSLSIEARVRLENTLPRLRQRAAASIYEQQLSAEISWMRQSARDAYAAGGHTDPRWDTAAQKAIDLAVVPKMDRTRTTRDDQRSIALIAAAIDAGCDDPLISFLYLRRLRQANRITLLEAARQMDKPVAGVLAGSYPAFWQMDAALFRADQLLGAAASRQARRTFRAAGSDITLARKLLPQITAAADFPRPDLRTISDQLLQLQIRLTQNPKEAEEQVADDLHAAGASESVILDFRGRYHVCVIRGDWNWCAVPPDQRFFTRTVNLDTEAAAAAECLSRSWQLDKNDPDAATMMVRLARLHGMPEEELNTWFSRAMEAYTNNFDACSEKMHYLMKYRDADAAIEFGRACLASGNWQGRIPFVLVDAHLDIAYRQRGDSYLGQDEVWKDSSTVCENYLKRYPHSARDRSFYTTLACRAGKWEIANREFQRLGDDAVIERFGGRADYAYWKRKAIAATQPTRP
jgi:hypothetical protein